MRCSGSARGPARCRSASSRWTRRAKLKEARDRLRADWEAKQRELADWRQAKADYTARTGRKMGGPTKPRPVPDAPSGRTNLTDPDSRPVKTARGFIQGYSAQAVATEEQIIIAADVTIGGNDRALLEPMITAAGREVEQAGITDALGVVLADAGYWNGPHIDTLVARGMEVLVRPDADTRKAPADCAKAAITTSCAPSSDDPTAKRFTAAAKPSSSPSSPTPRSADAPTASNAADWPPAKPNRGCWPPPTTSSSSGAAKQRPPRPNRRRAARLPLHLDASAADAAACARGAH